jgi:lysophospholipase L1-like esterase
MDYVVHSILASEPHAPYMRLSLYVHLALTPAAAAEKQLTVSVVGASISAGIGAEDAPAWVDRLEQYLKDTYGKVAGVNITVNNGAVPGTTSAYMAACVNLHVPRDADIIIVEYSVNDDSNVYPPMDNPIRWDCPTIYTVYLLHTLVPQAQSTLFWTSGLLKILCMPFG